jgi:glycosyltransferase involved in cell wall biosynthesis
VPAETRRLLLVSHRPLAYGGGGSARWRYLRSRLPVHGWEVHVVTARPNPTANEAATDPRHARLAAARAAVTGAIGDSTRSIANRFGVQPEVLAPNGIWSLTGRLPVRRAIERLRPHVVWATAPPPAAMFAAVPEAERALLPAVVELRDLWAGNPYFDAGGRLLARLEAPAMRRAAAVVTVTPGCVHVLRSLHPELDATLHLLPNGFDPQLLERRSSLPGRRPGERAVVLHAGTLYGDRTAERLIAGLSDASLRERVRLELVGPVDERTREAIRRAPAALEIDAPGPLAWEQVIDRTRSADVCAVINTAGTGGDMALPGKLFEALAIGRPVLALTPEGSDTERVLSDLDQADGCVARDDPDAIAAAVRRLLDKPPPPVPPARLEPWSRERITERTAALLDDIVASHHG